MASEWFRLPTIPSPKQIPEGYGYNGRVYVIGPAGPATSYVPSVEVWNPATNSWLPGPFAYVELNGGWERNAVGIGAFIYCIAFGRTYKYDIVANTWTLLSTTGNGTLNFNFGAYCAVGTDIFCFAGVNVKKFDTLTNTYATLGAWPNAHEGLAARYDPISARVYLGGGSTFTGLVPGSNQSLQSYNPATDTFTQLAYSPRGHGDVSGEILDNKFYLLGGRGSGAGNAEWKGVDVYDIAAGTWSQDAPLNYSASDSGSAVLNGRIYSFGGEADPFPASTQAIEVLAGFNGSLALTGSLAIPPVEDAFPGATIAGASGSASVSNVMLTRETGDPVIGGFTSRTAWWSWVAPTSVSVTFQTTGSTVTSTGVPLDTLLGVYTGAALGSLTTIGTNDDNGANVTSLVTFAATAGTTYRILVGYYNDVTEPTGTYVLSWS